jgi:CubicO group peptidase (beta-lactamase class C family)
MAALTNAGLTASDLPAARAELERGMALGWHTGAQLYAWLRGQTVADVAVGEARPGVPMTPSTLVEWASATKAVTCSAVALLWQRGRLDLDDPVCRHLPEFAAGGKKAVTVRHLLTHTGGLAEPAVDVKTWDQYAAAVCRAPLQEGWVPGTRCAYNSVAMWAVAALVVRLSGRPFREFVREELFGPLGLRDSWIGMPAEVYRAYASAGQVAAIPGYARSGTEEWVTWGRPTGGGHGPIGELGRFYVALLERRPPLPLSPPVIEAMTTRHLCGVYDERLNAVVDRGLGFQLGSSYPGHGYGPHASRRTFGHGGGSWSQAFADPDHGLAAAVYFNGRVDTETQAERHPVLLAALYEDLGLARHGRSDPPQVARKP